MESVPKNIEESFKKLKLEYPFPIELVKINGRFYVYKHTYIRNATKDQPNTVSQYIGKIEACGRFIKKEDSSKESSINPQIAHIEDIDASLLTNLSMNCRMSIPVLAERLGISDQATYKRIAKLESLFDIKYSANINYRNLGFFQFIILVKFLECFPDINEIKKICENKPEVQLAFLTSGKYDLLILISCRNPVDAQEVMHDMRSKGAFTNLNSVWDITLFNCTYGHLQARDEFFDSVVRERVWKRTKKNPKPKGHMLLYKDFVVLRELNKNGKIPFSEIDKIYGFGKGASKYAFENLEKKRILLEPTLLMKDINAAYNGIIILEVVNSRLFQKHRRKMLELMLESTHSFANKFTFAGEIGISDSIMLVLPSVLPGDIENEVKSITDNVKGIKAEKLIITKVLAGELCYRKMDNDYSSQHVALFKEYYNKVVENRTDYFSTSHRPKRQQL